MWTADRVKAELPTLGLRMYVCAHGWEGYAWGEVYANDDTMTVYLDWHGKELASVYPCITLARALNNDTTLTYED